jgi:hypothetical protein
VAGVALENAVSVTGILLLTEATLAEETENKPDRTPQSELA